KMKGRPYGRPKRGTMPPQARGTLTRPGGPDRGRLAPVAASAVRPATAAVVPARAGIVHAEVGAAHVAIAETRFARVRGRYDTAAGVMTAVQEVMRQLFAG